MVVETVLGGWWNVFSSPWSGGWASRVEAALFTFWRMMFIFESGKCGFGCMIASD